MTAIQDLDRPQKAPLIKARLLIVIMGTLCPVICYMSRQNLSMAILAMVNSSSTHRQILDPANSSFISIPLNNAVNPANICPAIKVSENSDEEGDAQQATETYGPQYEWSTSERSFVFETFWFCYVIFQIPGVRLAESIGAKYILATAAFGSSILSILSPLAASMNVYIFASIRALLGVCQASILPTCFVLYSKWLPPMERRRAIPVMTAGVYLGSIIASTTTGYFSEHKSFGWPWAFYLPSLVCFIWGVVWVCIGSSSPREHWFISMEEIDYIEARMETAADVKRDPSWKKILTSQAVWALMAGFAASNWAFTITLQLLPTYLNDVLSIPPFKNGLINSVIYILYIIFSPIVGVLSSRMVESKFLGFTHLQTRKLFECIGLFGQAASFAAITLLGCNTQLVLALLYTQIIVFSFIDGGEIQIPSELSLDFAGTIYAIGNCIGSCIGIIVTRAHSFMVTDRHDRDQWNSYFYLGTLVCALGGLIFLTLAKNDLQDFSKADRAKSVDTAAA